MTNSTITPRVYVACLASYNAGILHGRWIDADEGEDAIWTEIKAMLAESPTQEYGPAEEWAIHDHEYLGRISEYESIARVAELGEAVSEHGEAFLAWLEIADQDEDVSEFQDQYVGTADSEREYAEQEAGELGLGGIAPGVYEMKGDYSGRSEINVLEALESYIDWDKVAQEMFDHGPYVLRDGFVFRTY